MMSQSRKNGKSLKFPLRFQTMEQKRAAKKAAKKDGRSLNQFILRAIETASVSAK